MSLWAIVPVKPLRRGKSRLATILSEEERTFLNYTMLANTMKALAAVKEITQVLVVSRDTGALAMARDFNARTVQEDGSSDLNTALMRANTVALMYAAQSVLILPADLPLLTPQAVQCFIKHATHPPVLVINSDRRTDGTNAMLSNPGNLVNYRYGPGSFQLHVEQARNFHVRVEVCNIPELSLDLDLPEDLDFLRQVEGSGIIF